MTCSHSRRCEWYSLWRTDCGNVIIEYNEEPPREFVIGDHKSRLTLPTGQSYSSFVLLPLLTFALRRKCLLVGGPGRGKTASAILMGILAGYSLKDVRRAMLHGHPQMTTADLLGNPLPADLSGRETAQAPDASAGDFR